MLHQLMLLSTDSNNISKSPAIFKTLDIHFFQFRTDGVLWGQRFFGNLLSYKIPASCLNLQATILRMNGFIIRSAGAQWFLAHSVYCSTHILKLLMLLTKLKSPYCQTFLL
jgi:hypothetical protein